LNLFVESAEIIEAGQTCYSDVVYAIHRVTNGVSGAFNYVGKYERIIATKQFQRITVKIKETKIDASTTDSTYAIYDSLYITTTDNNIKYWGYHYDFDDGLKNHHNSIKNWFG